MRRCAASWVVCLLGASVMGGLGGCCHCLKPTDTRALPLPAPISMEQQVALLNARATSIPRLIAPAESGGVEVEYRDDNGQVKHKSVDGRLFLEQRYASHSANVRLLATYFSKDVIEAGNNDKQWWFIQYGQDAMARVGSVVAAPDAEGESVGKFVPRTDLVPKLLALTEITAEPGETMVMRVDDVRGVNDLLIERLREDGTAWIQREILVDRRSGEVREVDLYATSGELLVRATLDNYAVVKDERTAAAQEASGEVSRPMMPRSVVIESPGQHFRLGLTFAGFRIPKQMPEGEFETPDWRDLGIQPEVVK